MLNLIILISSELVLQIVFIFYAFYSVKPADEDGNNLLKGTWPLRIITSSIIFDDMILETIYLAHAVWLWVILDWGNAVPLAGVIVAHIFTFATAIIDIIVL